MALSRHVNDIRSGLCIHIKCNCSTVVGIKPNTEAKLRNACNAKNTLRYKIVNEKKKKSEKIMLEKITCKNNLTKLEKLQQKKASNFRAATNFGSKPAVPKTKLLS